MLSGLRSSCAPRAFARSFSSSQRYADMAKLTLLGRLVREPESRLTKNDKEYIVYTVSTRGFSPPLDANGERPPAPITYHRVISFSEYANKHLRTLKKGAMVYVESSFEVKEPDADAEPASPQAQRQIFLKHELIRVISQPKPTETPSSEDSEEVDSDNTRPLF